MDREYLEDYEQKEGEQIEKLEKSMRGGGDFSFEKDRYPPDERFIKLQRPVAKTNLFSKDITKLWAQVPFSGSLILRIPPISQNDFERVAFQISEIPKVIDFIKETGKLQIALNSYPTSYEGLDYLDPFFIELNPPMSISIPDFVFGTDKQLKKTREEFITIGGISYFEYLSNYISKHHNWRLYEPAVNKSWKTYMTLKLGNYTMTETIENLMVDDPEVAVTQLGLCQDFIVDPLRELRCDLRNFTMSELKMSEMLPSIHQPEDLRFPCEIGKFLLRKLTHVAQDMRACYALIDDYDAYDLQKVQESLNEAIITNNPDIVNKNTEELSEILDNLWNDPTILKRVKNLRRGVPMSIAAIGSAVSAFSGSLEGFLAGLGFSVGAKFLDIEIEGLSERLVKFFARSYQANVYDFKKKYKGKIARP